MIPAEWVAAVPSPADYARTLAEADASIHIAVDQLDLGPTPTALMRIFCTAQFDGAVNGLLLALSPPDDGRGLEALGRAAHSAATLVLAELANDRIRAANMNVCKAFVAVAESIERIEAGT